jgi:protease-4
MLSKVFTNISGVNKMSLNNEESGTKPIQPAMPPYPPPPYQRRRSSGWVIPLIVIGALVVLFFIFIAIMFASFSSMFESKQITVKENSVLYLTFDDGLQEYTKQNPFSIFTGGKGGASFLQTLRAIENAKTDDKINGIYLKPGMTGIGWAKAMELQDALEDFKTSGKFIYAFMEMGGEGQYFHSLPADTIFVPSEGLVEMNGFAVTSMFFTGLFEKLGIKYHVEHFEDFKSAGDMFSKTKFSDSARHQIQVIINQRFENFVSAIAKYRNLNIESVKSAINTGYYTADSLQALGFIDVLAQEMSVLEFIKYRANGDDYSFPLNVHESADSYTDTEYEGKLRLISPSAYISTLRSDKKEIYDENISIAIINGVGGINSGRDNSFNDDYSIRSGDYVRQLRKAREDENVKAIILRIDSPGGSVIGSDEIWEEIIKTRKVKPVYASMSDVAASGGYYMAMACDTIIAHPATITGSIGVVLAIPNFTSTMDKLGITTDTIATNKSAQFLNTLYPFDDASKQKLYTISRAMYDRFLNKVAKSRNMTYDEVRILARGRVWTGEDAMKHNLIDALGGLDDAIDMVKNRLGIPLDKKVYVRSFPEAEDDMVAFLRLFGLADDDDSDSKYKTNFVEALGFSQNQYTSVMEMMPKAIQPHLKHALDMYKMSEKENVLMSMPYLIEIK